MSVLLLAAAAAGFAPPSFTADELRQLEQGSAGVVIDAQVDPRGRISNCKAIATSGDAQQAAGICSRAVNVRIEPASVLGKSAYGVVRQAVGPAGAALPPSEIEVQVNACRRDRPACAWWPTCLSRQPASRRRAMPAMRPPVTAMSLAGK